MSIGLYVLVYFLSMTSRFLSPTTLIRNIRPDWYFYLWFICIKSSLLHIRINSFQIENWLRTAFIMRFVIVYIERTHYVYEMCVYAGVWVFVPKNERVCACAAKETNKNCVSRASAIICSKNFHSYCYNLNELQTRSSRSCSFNSINSNDENTQYSSSFFDSPHFQIWNDPEQLHWMLSFS